MTHTTMFHHPHLPGLELLLHDMSILHVRLIHKDNPSTQHIVLVASGPSEISSVLLCIKVVAQQYQIFHRDAFVEDLVPHAIDENILEFQICARLEHFTYQIKRVWCYKRHCFIQYIAKVLWLIMCVCTGRPLGLKMHTSEHLLSARVPKPTWCKRAWARVYT